MKLTKREKSLPAHVFQDRVVQRLTEAERALGHAVGIDQVKLVMDMAAAQEVFAKRQQLGEQVIGYAHTIKIRALAKLGELLKDLEKAKGTRGLGRPMLGGSVAEPPKGRSRCPNCRIAYDDKDGHICKNARPTLSEVLGLPAPAAKRIASVAQQLADLPPQTREAIAQREKTLSEARRERKAVAVRQAVKLPDAKFRVLYADPPWSYNDKADAGSVQSGGAEMHYPSMSIGQLCDMPITSLLEDNAVLFLWVTSPLLFESAAVIRAWGFTYKASFVWDKVKHNMGHYNSVRHEFLLVCTRGSCTPDVVQLFDSVQSIEKTTHSTKPEEFRRIIDTLYPHGKRLELFARRQAEGWTTYGNQVQQEAVS